MPAALTLPAGSVAVALIVVAPSAGNSPAAKVALQLPAPLAAAILLDEPQVTVTVELASAVPVTATPAPASVLLTMSSPATAATTGAFGAVVSIVTLRVPGLPTLPAESATVALIVVAPMVGSSPAAKLTPQLPKLSTAALLLVEPQVTATKELGSAVPDTSTPAADSLAFTTSSPATGLMTGTAGGTRSISTSWVPAMLVDPAAPT